jgi:hypothetical protein
MHSVLCQRRMGSRLRGNDGYSCYDGYFNDDAYFICGNANSAPALAVFGQRCITALWRV